MSKRRQHDFVDELASWVREAENRIQSLSGDMLDIWVAIGELKGDADPKGQDETTEILSFRGSSDDLVYCSSESQGEEELGAWNSAEGETVNLRLLVADRMRVYCIYDRRGCWSFSVAQVNEQTPIPPWPIRIVQGCARYSTELHITVPKGTQVTEGE